MITHKARIIIRHEPGTSAKCEEIPKLAGFH